LKRINQIYCLFLQYKNHLIADLATFIYSFYPLIFDFANIFLGELISLPLFNFFSHIIFLISGKQSSFNILIRESIVDLKIMLPVLSAKITPPIHI